MKRLLILSLMLAVCAPVGAQLAVAGKTIKFPTDCLTDQQRYAYCYRAQERVRIVHNIVGRWYKVGITEAQYDNGGNLPDAAYDGGTVFVRLPVLIKNLVNGGDYKAQLTETEWNQFKTHIYEPLQSVITAQLLKYRKKVREAATWSPDFDDFLKDE